MTRQEFEDNITWWGDLIDVCQEYGCEICDDIYYGDTMDELLCDSIRDEINHRTWYEVKELLEDIEWEGNDYYYRRDSEWDWKYLDDDDFFTYRDEVEAWLVDNGCFDDSDDDDDDERLPEYPAPAPEVEEEIEPEPFEIAELFTISNNLFQTLTWKQE